MKDMLKTFIFAGLAIFATILITEDSFASSGYFALSPMYQMMTLTPGETIDGNFQITNPANQTEDFYYELRVEPFTASNDNEISLTANGDYNQITDWITIYEPEGAVRPNSVKEVRFSIAVPEDAAAGGQYASIVVSSKAEEDPNKDIDIQEVYEMAHLIYADVAGDTKRGGDITDVSVPGFLFSGKITGSAKIKNLGNVHSRATHTLQIFPLFSDEEIYTNEENPETTFIMPGNIRQTSVTWEETPSIGIFHVIYNVEYEGVESKVDKIVIVCPLWLLFLILLALFLLIFRILSAKKKSRSEK